MKENILSNLKTYAFKEVTFDKLMQNRINKVLIVCSNYDFYMLEEDGRIEERIFNEYTSLNLRHPPNFIHANSARRAIKMMKTHQIEIVITWLDIGNYNAFETSKKTRVLKFERSPYMTCCLVCRHSELAYVLSVPVCCVEFDFADENDQLLQPEVNMKNSEH